MTRKRVHRNFETAREFSQGKASLGHNVDADVEVDGDRVSWVIYWSPVFLDVKNAVEA